MRHLEPKISTEDALGFLAHGGDNCIYFIGGHMSRLAYEGQRNTCGRRFGLSRGPQRLGDKHILLLSHLAGTQISLMEVWDYSRVAFLRFHCT